MMRSPSPISENEYSSTQNNIASQTFLYSTKFLDGGNDTLAVEPPGNDEPIKSTILISENVIKREYTKY